MPRIALLLVPACLLAAACASPTAEGVEAGSFVSGADRAFIAPSEREPAPAVEGETLDGEALSLAALEGPVVVNFWASWCGPCIQEAPDLAVTHEHYGPLGVHVVGVNVRDRRVNAQRFEADLAIPFPSWYDQSASIAASFGGVGPGALPSTIILDHEHRVAARLFGAVTFPQLRGYLDDILAEVDSRPGAG